jgi:ribosome-associated translation inhibitor RaiA
MAIPLQITFRDIMPSPTVSQEITERATKLNRFHPRIMSCRVVVRSPQKGSRKGRVYTVSIDLKIPGREIAVNHTPAAALAPHDVYVTIHDAFDVMERRLEDVVRRRRSAEKARPKE